MLLVLDIRYEDEQDVDRMPWLVYRLSEHFVREDAKQFSYRRFDKLYFKAKGEQLPYRFVGCRAHRRAGCLMTTALTSLKTLG
jgi:hypothetical protein